MNEPMIHCPNCDTEIKLTESLAAPIVAQTRRLFEARLADKENEIVTREEVARKQLADAAKARQSVEAQIAAGVAAGAEEIAQREAARVRQLLGSQLVEKDRALADAQAVLNDRDQKLLVAQKAQAELIRKERELEDARREMELTVERRLQPLIEAQRDELTKQLAAKDAELARQRQQIAVEESQKVRQLLSGELMAKDRALADANEILRDRDAKLAEAQNTQIELLKKQRELDDARRELELTVEKRVSESVEGVRLKAKQEAEDGLRLTITEREEQIAGMKRQIEDLKRRAEQGSQQLQGEVLELELESLLKSKFPLDLIEPVAKGELGGDVLHKVHAPGGVQCGTILWELKRTKNWSDGWLAKLRDNQRQAKADLAIIVSHVLPKAVEAFDQVEGVWVTERRCAVPVAIALRQTLIELQNSRQVQEGQQTKMGQLYDYLTGARFRHRIEAIVEKFGDMQADLQREKKAMTRLWAKREAQIQGVIEATAGMYGDMQGIVGRAMQEIPAIEIPLIDTNPAEQGKLDV